MKNTLKLMLLITCAFGVTACTNIIINKNISCPPDEVWSEYCDDCVPENGGCDTDPSDDEVIVTDPNPNVENLGVALSVTAVAGVYLKNGNEIIVRFNKFCTELLDDITAYSEPDQAASIDENYSESDAYFAECDLVAGYLYPLSGAEPVAVWKAQDPRRSQFGCWTGKWEGNEPRPEVVQSMKTMTKQQILDWNDKVEKARPRVEKLMQEYAQVEIN